MFRLWLVKLVVTVLGLHSKWLTEEVVKWGITKLTTHKDSQIGPKMKAAMDRTVEASRG